MGYTKRATRGAPFALFAKKTLGILAHMKGMRCLTRRQLLCLLAGLPLAAATSSRVHSQPIPLLPPEPAPGIRAGRRAVSAAELREAGSLGVQVVADTLVGDTASARAVSNVIAAPFAFQAVGAKWAGERGVGLFFRTSETGAQWSDWLAAGEEMVRDAGAQGPWASGLVFTADGRLHRFVQVCVLFPAGREPMSITGLALVFIDASAGPRVEAPVAATAELREPESTFAVSAEGLVTAQSLTKPAVVSRAEWGCPDPEGNTPGSDGLPWTKEYRSVTHIILHHTANSNTRPAAGWASVVRAIWYWHALEQPNAWGDIGYNYLIDPDGVIYEGRAGGDDVIGGHTGNFNSATMGVAIIGTYSTVSPTSQSLNAAERLMAWKADQKGFDPNGWGDLYQSCSNSYHWKERIASHRDFAGLYCTWSFETDPNNTTCPGDAFHALLPQIRRDTAAMLARPEPELSGISITPALVEVGKTLSLTVTIRNVGKATLRSGSPDPSFVYQEGQVAAAGTYDTFRLALDYEGHPSSQGPYPYRWGLGGDLAPGQSRTITVRVQINAESGPRQYWVGVVREGVGMAIDHQAHTTITARVKSFPGEVGIAKVRIAPATVFTQGAVMIVAEVQNWGTSPAPTQGPDPGYLYEEGQTCPADVAGAYRIGVDYDGRTQTKDHPYRWGIGTVPPLSVRTVTGYIRMPKVWPKRNFWVGFVREQVGWLQDRVAQTGVTVQVPKSRSHLPVVTR